MQGQEIEHFLQELGDELEQKGLHDPVKIMMVGGAYMLLQVHNRKFTEDIDIFPLNFEASSHPSKQTKAFQAAARAVAKRHGLKRDWINDVAATMLGGLGPDPEVQLWATFNKLEVYIPKLDYILAMKLFAGREKDGQDIAALCELLGVGMREQAQAVLDAYVYPRWQKEYNVAQTLDALF